MADASLLDNLGPGEAAAITFEVTQDDIDHGRRRDCKDCPIARSAAREFPGYHVLVDSELGLENRESRNYYCASLPGEARAFIVDFDQGWPVNPFSFTASFQAIH